MDGYDALKIVNRIIKEVLAEHPVSLEDALGTIADRIECAAITGGYPSFDR